MTTTVTVTEDAGGASVTQTGKVTPGGRVVGVAIAGQSTDGVGSVVRGTYGALTIADDGSFSYRLDGADRDTRLIGAGETAFDRFTYTYLVDGVARTETIVIAVSGVDQPGVTIVRSDKAATYTSDATIGEATRVIHEGSTFPNTAVAVGDLFYGGSAEYFAVTNGGAILASSPTGGYMTGASTAAFRAAFVNEGRVAVTAATGPGGTTGIVGSIQVPPLAAPVVNGGVVQVTSQATGAFPPLAIGIEGRTVDNGGTVYVVASSGLAYGIGSRPAPVTVLDNRGTIFASSGDKTEASGIAATGVFAYGSNISIRNSGTITAEATADGMRSAAFRVFTNSNNPLAGGTIVNSGRVVADYAVWSFEGYWNSIVFSNTGYVQGDWLSDKNTMAVFNAAASTWRGNLTFGYDPDMVRNDGLITGTIRLGGGADLYDGSRGTTGAQIFGNEGNDVLRGTSADHGGDLLDGGAGDDVLFGGRGDVLTGGSGADRFVVSGAAEISDFESGRDVIDLSPLAPTGITITVGGGITLITAGTTQGAIAVSVRGSVVAGDIVTTAPGTAQAGTSAADILVARSAAAHRLSGDGGDDVLVGGDGADVLDGGTGDDVMYGGEGDDIYYVDVFGDRAIELVDGGIDEVRTTTAYLLAPNIENGRIIGTDAVGLTGNDLNNVLWGNDAFNELNGGGGDDILYGGLGADRMIGNSGADRFVYRNAQESVAGRFDHLVLFETGIDKIDLTAIGIRSVAFDHFNNPWAGQFGNYTTATITTAAGETMVIRADGRLDRSDFLGFVNPLPNEVVTAIPGDGGTGAQVTANVRFIFAGLLTRGAGLITLAKSDGTIVETFAADSSRLSIDGRLLTIDPTRPLEAGTSYTVSIASGALTVGGAAFAGFSGYGFTTATLDTAERFQLIASDGAIAAVSGSGSVFGFRSGLQDVTVLDTPGRIVFDPSFNAGGDRIRLAGASGSYSVSRGGTTVFLDDGDSIVEVPVGLVGTDIRFADGTFSLVFDQATSSVKLGSQTVTTAKAAISAAPGAGTVTAQGDPAIVAKMVAGAGKAATANGLVDVFGSRDGAETVAVARGGTVTFDPSFNAGGDVVALPGSIASYTMARSGSSVRLASATETVVIPLSLTGLTLRFGDAERTLVFDQTAGAAKLGAQTIGTTATALAAPGAPTVVALAATQSAAGGDFRFTHAGDATPSGTVTGFGRGDTLALGGDAARYVFAGSGGDVTIGYVAADGTFRTTTIAGIADPALAIFDRASAETAAGFAIFGV